MDIEHIEGFHGCYLLVSESEKRCYRGRTYIGYTTDPNRRIVQHNLGKRAGGAKKTSDRGPWRMVLVVHGFPNEISALRFEWAWQNPDRSRRLSKLIEKKSRKESQLDYKIKILGQMLNVGPWTRLPLTLRWLEQEHEREFSSNLTPPLHIKIASGLVKASKNTSKNPNSDVGVLSCSLCEESDDMKLTYKKFLCCPIPSCKCQFHIHCLAAHFLKDSGEELLPCEGNCPCCKSDLLWGDLYSSKVPV